MYINDGIQAYGVLVLRIYGPIGSAVNELEKLSFGLIAPIGEGFDNKWRLVVEYFLISVQCLTRSI